METLAMRLAIAAVLCGCLSSAAAHAEEAGNPGRGQAYAETHCAGCHAVMAEESVSPNPDSPAFRSIADTPGITRTALTAFFQTPHPTMPNLMIEAEDRDDIIAYILSLRTGHKTPRGN